MRYLLVICSFFLLYPIQAQVELIEDYEDSLSARLDHLRTAFKDQHRNKANAAFSSLLKQTLQLEGAFNYPFKKLVSIGKITSPDNTFRIFNWNVENDDLTHTYYAFILKCNGNNCEIIELQDKSREVNKPESKALDEDKWFGTLYYDIIPQKSGSKTYYTLLGWDLNDRLSSKSVIDVMFFNGRNVKFGAPIFKEGGAIKKRVIFEYAKESSMAMRYNEKNNRIVFDHLAPPDNRLEGQYKFYVPDLSYDAFEYDNGKWVYLEDVDVTMDKDWRDKYWNKPPPSPLSPPDKKNR